MYSKHTRQYFFLFHMSLRIKYVLRCQLRAGRRQFLREANCANNCVVTKSHLNWNRRPPARMWDAYMINYPYIHITISYTVSAVASLHIKKFRKTKKKRRTLMVNYLVNNNNKDGARGHMLAAAASSRGQMPILCGSVEIKLGGRKLGKRVDGWGKRQLHAVHVNAYKIINDSRSHIILFMELAHHCPLGRVYIIYLFNWPLGRRAHARRTTREFY